MAETEGILVQTTKALERVNALEALWSATKADWRGGYSPEFTAAVQRLKKLEEAPRSTIDPGVTHAAGEPQSRDPE